MTGLKFKQLVDFIVLFRIFHAMVVVKERSVLLVTAGILKTSN